MSGFLLDTHAAIWWWTADPRLGSHALRVIANGAAPIYVSAASVWEIAIKHHAGRLTEIEDFSGQYRPLMSANGFASLPLSAEHALHGGYLAGEHRDPFDRLIAAQALLERLTVLTRDPQIAAFGCETLW